MEGAYYWLGVVLAIGAGISRQTGLLVQKKVINSFPLEKREKLMRNLIRSPLWIFAFVVQMGIGSFLFLAAQIFIGPALIPGLMSAGLIVLALGSIKVLGEKLNVIELSAIGVMILAISMLGLSGLSIELVETDLLDLGFITRMVSFSCIIAIVAISFQVFQERSERYRGLLLALLSGLMYTLSNLWVSPLMAVIVHIFGGSFILEEFIWFMCSISVLFVTIILGIVKMAQAMKFGQAGNLVPIQGVPVQIAPIFYYFLVFSVPAPSLFSIIALIGGVALIIMSSFFLGRRQAQLEEI